MIINLAKIDFGRSGGFSVILNGKEYPVYPEPTPTEELRVSKSVCWVNPEDYFKVFTNLSWEVIGTE